MDKKNVFKGLVCILISVVFIATGCNTDKRQTLGILSYNVWIGFQQDSTREMYLNWVGQLNPDIIAYQEMNYYTQRKVENLAGEHSHPYAIISKEEGFPVAVSSKFPIVNVQKVLDNMHHGYIYGVTNNIHVFAVHFSPSNYKKRQEEIKTVLAHASLLPPDEMIMIIGDFNALSPSDSIYYSDGFVNARREEQSERVQNLRDGNLDFSVIRIIEDAGYKDVFRMFNNGFKSSFSTATRVAKVGEHKGGGMRIDYAFVNPVMAKHVISADIIHDNDTELISDHYPVYFEIKI
jgi:exodeoxyribonuclease III